MIDLLIIALAVWYISYSLTSTHGPGGVFDWLREWRSGRWHGRRTVKNVQPDGATKTDIVSGLLDCPVCLAFWAALILTTVTLGRVDLVQTLAAAGLAMLAHGWTGWRYNVG